MGIEAFRRTAIVTGASAGIGAAIARRLVDEGNTVVTLQRKPPPFAHERLHFYPVDLTRSADLRAVMAEVQSRFEVGMLVNNAGANRPGPLMGATEDDLQHVVDLNLRAAMLLVQALVPRMRELKYGRILSIASRAVLGKANRTVYAMTKAGLVGFSRTIALELGADGITVNVIAPGPIATELFNNGHPEGSEQRRTTIANIVVKRMGEPQDIARAAWFLLEPAAGYITGQTLFVCGGTSIGSGGI